MKTGGPLYLAFAMPIRSGDIIMQSRELIDCSIRMITMMTNTVYY